ncbi:MAG: thiamine-phosphate pyrophosphorylase [Nitratiruptor sp.]|nr:thiamine-phosphate pyrophosphorylase [Nitratiruptor sp.]NPA83126.1 thiamine-phosphate pyrophosphorylase [Campylobacterota bacterium]
MSEPRLFRLIDANLNRLREGIRVVEDLCRYLYDDQPRALKLKTLRHQVRFDHPNLLQARDVTNDPLKESSQSELERTDIAQLFQANLKRAQESARVLEETLKLLDAQAAEGFKRIRYELYAIERELFLTYFDQRKSTSNSR